MFQIMVVEDDPALQKMIGTFLTLNGYQTMLASNGEEALTLMEHIMPDLVVADVMMPVMDGWELTEELRRSDPMLPIILVPGRESLDYLTKPVDLNELLLHISALLRRAQVMSSHQLTVGETVLDYDRLTVTRGDQELTLPKKEFYLLFKLLSSPRQIFTRTQLMDEIWGMDTQSDERTVDVHIKRLREKCEAFPDFTIVTVRGLGYKAEKSHG